MNDTSIFVIIIAAITTNNILLVKFLGMCSFLACSRKIETSVGLGVAVIFVMTATSALNYLIYYYVLVPYGLTHLALIFYIAIIAAFVQFVEMFIERFSPPLYHALGIFLPLITVNCAILGTSIFMIQKEYSFVQSVASGFGGGLGWLLAIVLIAGLRKKMTYSDVPQPFQGVAIVMIVTGLMALAFTGFGGAVNA